MPDPAAFRMGEVFGAIAGSLIVQQQRLDAEYLGDLNVFEECFRQTTYSSLAREFVPARQVVRQAQVECALGVRRTQNNTFSVRLANRVYASRHMYSQRFDTNVQLTIQRVALPMNTKNS